MAGSPLESRQSPSLQEPRELGGPTIGLPPDKVSGSADGPMIRREFNQLAGLTGAAIAADQLIVQPAAQIGQAVRGVGKFLGDLAASASRRDEMMKAWVEHFDKAPFMRDSFTLFREENGNGKTYQLAFTVNDSSLIPHNDKPYTQITIHGLKKEVAKQFAQLFGATKLTLADNLSAQNIGKGALIGGAATTFFGRKLFHINPNAVHNAELFGAGAILGGTLTAMTGAIALSFVPPDERRQIIETLIDSAREKLSPILSLFNGSSSNIPENQPTEIAQSVAVFTSTPKPTVTFTQTPTLEASLIPTATATVTATASETPTPTETPRLLMSWVSPEGLTINESYSWENAGWTSLKDNGAVSVEVINHPTFGPSLRYVVNKMRLENNQFRTYPEKKAYPLEGRINWRIKMPVIFGDGYLPYTSGAGVSVMSMFSQIGDIDGYFQALAGVDIGSGLYPIVSVKNPALKDADWQEYRAVGTIIKPNTPYIFELYTDGDYIYLDINGKGVVNGLLHPSFVGLCPKGFHAGAYGHLSEVGSELVNGPISISFYAV